MYLVAMRLLRATDTESYVNGCARVRVRSWDWRSAISGVAALALPLLSMAATGGGDYTREQAQAGAQVYSATCSVCHGSKLQGGAAPALTGATFGQTLQNTYSTTRKLYDVISTLMPVNNPGSLSKEQYTDVLAFILAENAYPAGTTALDTAHLEEVALLPYPDQGAKKATDTNLEIQNIGTANRLVVGALPDIARVTITDAMMGAVDSHPGDWLLHGRDYSNQRFSLLKDINAANVAALAPVALVQTGITSSFETTPVVVNGVMYVTTPVLCGPTAATSSGSRPIPSAISKSAVVRSIAALRLDTARSMS
jgi:alcohol dehydrogenase (cytochrome c)